MEHPRSGYKPGNFSFVNLKTWGYSYRLPERDRHDLLEQIFSHLTKQEKDEIIVDEIARSLDNLHRLHKNRNPISASIFAADAAWLRSTKPAGSEAPVVRPNRGQRRPRSEDDDDDDADDRPAVRRRINAQQGVRRLRDNEEDDNDRPAVRRRINAQQGVRRLRDNEEDDNDRPAVRRRINAQQGVRRLRDNEEDENDRPAVRRRINAQQGVRRLRDNEEDENDRPSSRRRIDRSDSRRDSEHFRAPLMIEAPDELEQALNERRAREGRGRRAFGAPAVPQARSADDEQPMAEIEVLPQPLADIESPERGPLSDNEKGMIHNEIKRLAGRKQARGILREFAPEYYSPGMNQDALIKALRRCMVLWHPDKNANRPLDEQYIASALFRLIQPIYEEETERVSVARSHRESTDYERSYRQ